MNVNIRHSRSVHFTATLRRSPWSRLPCPCRCLAHGPEHQGQGPYPPSFHLSRLCLCLCHQTCLCRLHICLRPCHCRHLLILTFVLQNADRSDFSLQCRKWIRFTFCFADSKGLSRQNRSLLSMNVQFGSRELHVFSWQGFRGPLCFIKGFSIRIAVTWFQITAVQNRQNWESPAELQGHSGTSSLESRKVRSPKPFRPQSAKKCPLCDSFLTLLKLLPIGPEVLGWDFGPEGPEWPCSSSGFSQHQRRNTKIVTPSQRSPYPTTTFLLLLRLCPWPCSCPSSLPSNRPNPPKSRPNRLRLHGIGALGGGGVRKTNELGPERVFPRSFLKV